MISNRHNLARQLDAVFSFQSFAPAPQSGDCPGLRPDGTLMALPQIRTDASRLEVLHYFQNGWAMSELLFSSVTHPSAFVQDVQAGTLLGYALHIAARYASALRASGLLERPVNEALESTFAQSPAADILPTLEEAQNFRGEVYAAVTHLIENHPRLPLRASDESPSASPLWSLFMAMEHERACLESITALLRRLPLGQLRRPAAWPSAYSAQVPQRPQRWITVPPCQVILGKPKATPAFGWSEEYGLEVRPVKAFSACATLTTNGEFREFLLAGGYVSREFWSEEGWRWKQSAKAKAPAFWVGEGQRLRTLFEEIDMPADWPALVNLHEARAYAAWRARTDGHPVPYRLPTEAEHNALRDANGHVANIDMRYGSECPVRALPASSRGFHDVMGNAWQWSDETCRPLAGSHAPAANAESGHPLLLGGSYISSGTRASRFARMASAPDALILAGIRLVRSESR